MRYMLLIYREVAHVDAFTAADQASVIPWTVADSTCGAIVDKKGNTAMKTKNMPALTVFAAAALYERTTLGVVASRHGGGRS